jgi:hypothetical protein
MATWRRSPWFARTAIALLFGFMAAVLISIAMTSGLNHDEHQFVAAGALLARYGLLPYRDYPYFHLPMLVFVYGAIFKATDYLLLAARGFNVCAAWILLIMVFRLSTRALREQEYPLRIGVSVAVTLLLFTNPLFRYTEGRAWNHDFPALLAIFAFSCACTYPKRIFYRKVLVFLAGIFLGGAVTSRLTFAPLALPFLAIVLFGPNSSESKQWPMAALFTAGLVIALLPTLLLFWMDPHRFLFDNFTYHRVINRSFRIIENRHSMTTGGAILFPFGLILKYPSNAWVLLVFAYLVLWKRLIRWNWRGDPERRLTFILVLLPFAIVGCFVPRPPFTQYYYDLVPFLILGIVYSLAGAEPRLLSRYLVTFFGFFLVCGAFSGFDLSYLKAFRTADQWLPLTVHSMGLDMKKASRDGRILTLSPIFPLEGGLNIYPKFATGAFAWRTAEFIPKKEQEELGFVDAEDLSKLLDIDPPAGVLLGDEPAELERPFLEFAQKNQYTLHPLNHDYSLWIAPTNSAADQHFTVFDRDMPRSK